MYRLRTGEHKYLKTSLIKRDGRHCHYCNIYVRKYKLLTIDHIKNFKDTRDNSLDNLVLACHNCNLAKQDMNYCKFKKSLETKGLDWRDLRAQIMKIKYRNKKYFSDSVNTYIYNLMKEL